MLIELLEEDERALVDVLRSYRRAMSERGLDPGIVTPDSLVRSLVHREAETVSQPGHALWEFHSTGPAH